MPEAVQKCLVYFPSVDRTVTRYEGLIAAQACLPNNEIRDYFAADCSYLARLWEAISADPVLTAHETDYRWLTHVYESVRIALPSTFSRRSIGKSVQGIRKAGYRFRAQLHDFVAMECRIWRRLSRSPASPSQ